MTLAADTGEPVWALPLNFVGSGGLEPDARAPFLGPLELLGGRCTCVVGAVGVELRATLQRQSEPAAREWFLLQRLDASQALASPDDRPAFALVLLSNVYLQCKKCK